MCMLHRKKQHIYLPILFTFISYSFGIKMLHRQTRAEGIQSKMKRKLLFFLKCMPFCSETQYFLKLLTILHRWKPTVSRTTF